MSKHEPVVSCCLPACVCLLVHLPLPDPAHEGGLVGVGFDVTGAATFAALLYAPFFLSTHPVGHMLLVPPSHFLHPPLFIQVHARAPSHNDPLIDNCTTVCKHAGDAAAAAPSAIVRLPLPFHLWCLRWMVLVAGACLGSTDLLSSNRWAWTYHDGAISHVQMSRKAPGEEGTH